MVDTVIVFLLKSILALALATFVLAWLACIVSVIAFQFHVYRRTDSFDPLGAFAQLRDLRDRGAFPPELSHIQLWQRRIWRAAVISIGVAALSGMSLVLLAALHPR